MEDIDVRRAMETSDMPKLSERFGKGERFGKIAWNVMRERVAWGIQKFKWKRIEEIRNDDNPLISLFTWTVMVPVGGTFCSKFLSSFWMVFGFCCLSQESQSQPCGLCDEPIS